VEHLLFPLVSSASYGENLLLRMRDPPFLLIPLLVLVLNN